MAAKIHERNGVLVSQNSHFSYVLSITLPQPTIRIKIPKVLVKAMQRRNHGRRENDAIHKKESFRKKVGSMASSVFGKNNNSPEAASDEAMMKLKKMIESLDMESEKNGEDEYVFNDGVMVLVDEKEMVEAEEGDEGKEELAMVVEAGNERKERLRLLQTYSKKISNVGNDDSGVVCVDDNEGKGTHGMKEGNGSNDMTWSQSRRQKPKIAWLVKRITEKVVGVKSKEEEVWRKRILMGEKCKPLN
ncbi:hypothetical protein Golob_013947 [Gossypium lobatum]|uniref:Uncharacterized protein n=1 Tax=Gossypium lobatum TaxID=34289 RepID=A0A7J8LRE1_9ROSI|nr:hypothetical protein [Gossypium lobatum]